MKLRKIILNDGKGERQETINGVLFSSSGGVPPAWAALLALLPRGGRILDYGSWQGLACLWLKLVCPDAKIEFAHTSSALIAQVRDNATVNGFDLVSQAMFPLKGCWQTIILSAPEQNEALAMLLGQAAACLAVGGQVLVVDTSERTQELARYFTEVKQMAQGVNWSIAHCTGARPPSELLPWRKISLRLLGLDLRVESLPGNFSPQGLDRGTRAMLEEAQIPAGGRVLDLGCGYGVVGVVASQLGAGEVVYIDDDLTALVATRRNLENLDLDGELVHSHHPFVLMGKFACILINPPYHSDYSVAKSFLNFAVHRLEEGGWLYLVVKKPDWYVRKLRTLLGGGRVLEQDGYTVIAAQKRRGEPGKAVQPAKTTRKHARRQETRGRRRKK